ncbi:hypothetical protein [Hydrogenimonas sp.]
MRIDEFMRDFFHTTERVTVDAVKLQKLLADYDDLKRQNRRLKDRVASLEAAVEIMKGRELLHVKLDEVV